MLQYLEIEVAFYSLWNKKQKYEKYKEFIMSIESINFINYFAI